MKRDKIFNDWLLQKLVNPDELLVNMFYDVYLLGKQNKRKKKESHPAFKLFVKIWFEELHPTHKFSSEDGRAINGLIEKMSHYCEKKWQGQKIPDEQYLEQFFRHFYTHLPDFYKSETLPTLNRKFYAIIDQLTKGKTANPNQRPGSVTEIQLWAESLRQAD
jgi:hypothetical protein